MVTIPVLPHVQGMQAIRFGLPYVMHIPWDKLKLISGAVGDDGSKLFAVLHFDDLLTVVVGECTAVDQSDTYDAQSLSFILPIPRLAHWMCGEEYWALVERLLGFNAVTDYLAGKDRLEFNEAEIMRITQAVHLSVRFRRS